jgi:hypothetical protein
MFSRYLVPALVLSSFGAALAAGQSTAADNAADQPAATGKPVRRVSNGISAISPSASYVVLQGGNGIGSISSGADLFTSPRSNGVSAVAGHSRVVTRARGSRISSVHGDRPLFRSSNRVSSIASGRGAVISERNTDISGVAGSRPAGFGSGNNVASVRAVGNAGIVAGERRSSDIAALGTRSAAANRHNNISGINQRPVATGLGPVSAGSYEIEGSTRRIRFGRPNDVSNIDWASQSQRHWWYTR